MTLAPRLPLVIPAVTPDKPRSGADPGPDGPLPSWKANEEPEGLAPARPCGPSGVTGVERMGGIHNPSTTY